MGICNFQAWFYNCKLPGFTLHIDFCEMGQKRTKMRYEFLRALILVHSHFKNQSTFRDLEWYCTMTMMKLKCSDITDINSGMSMKNFKISKWIIYLTINNFHYSCSFLFYLFLHAFFHNIFEYLCWTLWIEWVICVKGCVLHIMLQRGLNPKALYFHSMMTP